MPNEIELKLRLSAADKQKLDNHPAIKQHLVGSPTTRALVSIFYDTPEFALLDAGIDLRVRSMSGGWFQAVKSTGHSASGLHQRLEWEDLLTKNEPDFDKITEPQLARIFANPSLRQALKPIFIVDVMRTDWQLKYADGTEIEVSLDLGELKVPHSGMPEKGSLEKTEPINELEIELKHGNLSHVFALALALQTEIPFIIENISKAQRGYACLKKQATTRPNALLQTLLTSQPYQRLLLRWNAWLQSKA